MKDGITIVKDVTFTLFDYIKGTLVYITPEYIVLDNQQIGYQVRCPNNYQFQKYMHEEMIVYTYHYVREDQFTLYGFETREEKMLFQKLIQVSGIGPKGALAILASGHPEHIVQAIEEENEQFLVKFPGVGKKTARQIILDLKGKLDDLAPDLFRAATTKITVSVQTEENGALKEAIEALKALGYSEREIKKITPMLEQETGTTDMYLKRALQLMLK